MLDIALIREKPEWVKEQLRKLNDEKALERIDAILELDKRRRVLLTEVETIKANRNQLNKQFGMFRGNKKLAPGQILGGAQAAVQAIQAGNIPGALDVLNNPPAADGAIEADQVQAAVEELTRTMKGLGDRVTEIDAEVREVETALEEHMLWIPNMPHDSVPVGMTDQENIPHEERGPKRQYDFTPQPHWDLGPALDVIDFERGVKLSGTRFYILKAAGARLYRAMIYWLLDVHTTQHGYTEIYPPFMVHEDALYGSAQFPKFKDVVYFDQESELFMLPTAEVALTNMHRDEILEEEQLPLRYVAHTPCFRREKMSAGRDVRGIKRVHQFEKVELYKFTTPENSYDELEKLVQNAEHVCEMLQIPYRRLEIVTGDLGFAAAKKYDIEMWAPGSQEWLEVSSCSNVTDFQARRSNIRYRPAGGKVRFVHTLNGSGLGMVRALIAVLENYQQADGSVVIPDVLRPYLGGMEVIEPK
ncbi:MAG TPA: serine--tRNA ligase [Aggregatilineaceae bacterium]|nr:serine--tRNA ligase [Aggregatilineaceae bacterium]